ncbi:MAG: glycoside hydrolase family 5 protein [Clostridia bacterium]|nr:glycoside hydrolase family 5 protein [Clostridia bacterium]
MKKKFLIFIVVMLIFIIIKVDSGDNNNISPESQIIENNKGINTDEKITNATNRNENNKELSNSSPLSCHGKLKVKSGKVINENGKEFIIQGISTHSISEFSQYINCETFKTLKEDFNINTIRLAMYTQEELGYSQELHLKIDEGVKYATELGLYVIIDWHILKDNDPNINKESAKIFFEEMAYKYKDYNNVIYEICNEPNGDVSWDDIKKYAIEIIKIIRNHDKDGIIIIGTPNYCQKIEEAEKNPIEGYNNLLYSFHFYAGTHKKELREKLEKVVDSNFPVIISEFGISEASGTGNVDENEANIWINYLRKNKIGYICWNLSNKDEASAILNPGVQSLFNWNVEELSKTGLWLKNIYNK